MNAKTFLRSFAMTFALVFVVSAVVSFLYNLIAHGQGAFEWEVAFRMGLILGIALPLIPLFEKKK